MLLIVDLNDKNIYSQHTMTCIFLILSTLLILFLLSLVPFLNYVNLFHNFISTFFFTFYIAMIQYF